MAGKQFRKSGAFAALAIGLAVAALPAAANAQDNSDRGRHGGWSQGGGEGRGRGGDNGGGNWRGGGNGGNGGGDRWQQRQQAQAQQAPQVQVQQAPPVQQAERQGRFWGQRGGDGGQAVQQEQQLQGRVGTRNRIMPQVDQRSYSDPNRNGSYTPRTDVRRWDGDRRGDGDRRWDGNRGGTWSGDRSWSGNRGGSWSRDWRRDNRYDWQGWRDSHRNTYNLGRYYAPYRGWSYRRLGIGFTLQPLFFGQDYWIDDPWMYRLPEAYGPYRWVRYYDDALLVNIYNGEVADVIYDFFW